jgi:hypothetical protein
VFVITEKKTEISTDQKKFLATCKGLWDNSRRIMCGKDDVTSDIACIDIYIKLISYTELLATMVEDIKQLRVMDKLGHEISYSLSKKRYQTTEMISPILTFDIHFGRGLSIGMRLSNDDQVEFIYKDFIFKNTEQDIFKLKNLIFKHIAVDVTSDLLNPNLRELLLY